MRMNRLASLGRSSAERLLVLSNHDFCPWANRYVYWLKQPIGWFAVAALAAALTAAFLEPRMWLIFGSLVAVMLLGVVWPWLAIRGTTAEIAFDCRRCREGQPVQVRLAVHNIWPWPQWGLAVENGFFLPTPESGARAVAALARVSPWSRSEFVFEFRPEQRGVYPHDVPALTTGFPFGIWRASRPASVDRELLVWPRTTPLTSIPSLGGDIADVIGMQFDRPGHEGDMTGVRPFRQGDRLRSIHWAQTARRNALIVTERQATARRLVHVAVDFAAFNQDRATDGSRQYVRLETAIRVGASIAQEFHAHHAEVRFVMGSIDLMLSPDIVGLHRLLDALARFDIEQAPPRPRTAFTRGDLAVIVTSSEFRTEWEAIAAPRGSLRLVLIDTDDNRRSAARESSPRAHHAAGDRRGNVWMRLDGHRDESLELRHQWERVCHDSLAK